MTAGEGQSKSKTIFKENVQQNKIVSPKNRKEKVQSEYKKKAKS